MAQINPNNINSVTLYTGGNGQSKCICNCPCCTQKYVSYDYQGTIEQIDEILKIFPNLKQLYILGNPDPAVDTSFCNQASLLSISQGVNVCYSTSGVGGTIFLKKLLNGVHPDNVDYISFSIDSVDPNKMSLLKGIKFPWNNTIDGIKWAVNEGYKVKIQPTLWPCNYMDAYSIVDYFTNLGVYWYSFHIGSLETNDSETYKHLSLEQVKNVHDQITCITNKYPVKVTCPVIYPSLGENDSSKWFCMNLDNCKDILIFLKENGIYGTHLPIATDIDKNLLVKLEPNKEINIKQFPQQDYCPFSEKTTSDSKTLCRYIKRKWN